MGKFEGYKMNELIDSVVELDAVLHLARLVFHGMSPSDPLYDKALEAVKEAEVLVRDIRREIAFRKEYDLQ